MVSLDLAVNAIVAGLLLGGFYAAVTVGVTISFGMLDIVNIAHPAFIMLEPFVAYIVNSNFGIDPILIGVVMAPAFFSSAWRSIRSTTMPSNGAAAVIEREPVRAGRGRCVVPGPTALINCGTWRCCRSASRSAIDVSHPPAG
jgi:branched-subunit amino acid ABC-type transport system permease component